MYFNEHSPDGASWSDATSLILSVHRRAVVARVGRKACGMLFVWFTSDVNTFPSRKRDMEDNQAGRSPLATGAFAWMVHSGFTEDVQYVIRWSEASTPRFLMSFLHILSCLKAMYGIHVRTRKTSAYPRKRLLVDAYYERDLIARCMLMLLVGLYDALMAARFMATE